MSLNENDEKLLAENNEKSLNISYYMINDIHFNRNMMKWNANGNSKSPIKAQL